MTLMLIFALGPRRPPVRQALAAVALARKTALRAKTKLRRKTPLRNRAPLNPVNEDREQRRRLFQFGPEEYRPWLLGFPCVVCQGQATDMAHVTSRATGGTWRDIVPMCRTCHGQQHAEGWSALEERTGWDHGAFLSHARELAANFAKQHPNEIKEYFARLRELGIEDREEL